MVVDQGGRAIDNEVARTPVMPHGTWKEAADAVAPRMPPVSDAWWVLLPPPPPRSGGGHARTARNAGPPASRPPRRTPRCDGLRAASRRPPPPSSGPPLPAPRRHPLRGAAANKHVSAPAAATTVAGRTDNAVGSGERYDALATRVLGAREVGVTVPS